MKKKMEIKKKSSEKRKKEKKGKEEEAISQGWSCWICKLIFD